MTTFADLGVPAALVRSLAERGITSPFPIQTATLPDSLAGRDVLGRGRTGSGKTIAFALPVVARLAASPRRTTPRRPRALVLAPTRELASQIDETLAPLAAAAGLRTTTIFGGVAQSRQVAALDRGIDIVVACPGRLEDLIGQGLVTLDGIEVAVLDEADHMADLGFLPVVRRLLDRTPSGGQRLLFSATLDNGVDVLVKRFLTKPVEHAVDPAAQAVVAMTHHVLEVRDAAAKKAVVHQLASGTGRRVLFMRTKHHAKKLAKQLTSDGIPAVDLHGNLGQGARERNLAAFSSGEVRVLVATDIAARGIHVDDVELVVHVDPPAEHKAYLHRSGRTARAGSGGDVVTLVLPEQRADVRALTRAAKITAELRPVTPGDATLSALVGDVAPHVAPQPAAPQGAGARSSRSGRGTARPAPARTAAGGANRSGGDTARASGGTPRTASGAARTASAASGTAPARTAPAQPRRATRPASAPADQRAATEGTQPAGTGAPRRRRGGRGRGRGAGAQPPRA